MLAPERGPRWQTHAQRRNLRISVRPGHPAPAAIMQNKPNSGSLQEGSAFLDISRQVAVPGFSGLGYPTQGMPALPVLARCFSGCLNSGNLDISRQVAAPACQALDSQLGTRSRQLFPWLPRGGERRLGAKGVEAASDGRALELDHRVVLLLGRGELGGGEPPRHVPPRDVGGVPVNTNLRLKRPW